MPPKQRVVRCELEEFFLDVLDKAKSHGYKTISEAIRAGLRLLDGDMSGGP
jgi:Arc/MetJ-type ribon-helix-helix transcriptional regulator